MLRSELMTIRELVEVLSKTDDVDDALNYAMGNFLDFFRSDYTDDELRADAIREEPEEYDNIVQGVYAYIASSVHYLCLKYELDKPDWIFEKKYFSKDPYFPNKITGITRYVLLMESPTVFRARNVFVSENPLFRV